MKRTFLLLCLLIAVCLSQPLQAGSTIPPFSTLNKVDHWTSNASGCLRMQWDAEENAMRFTTTFRTGADFWVYPVFKLAADNQSLAGASSISFEIKASSDQIRCAFLMLLPNDRKIPYDLPSTNWKRVVIPLTKDMDLDKVTAFRLGLNPKEETFTYWIRGLRINTPESTSDVAAFVTSDMPGMVFTEGNAVILKANQQQQLMKPVRYTISDFWGTRVKNGEWNPSASATLDLGSMPLGYYYLELASDEVSFIGSRSFAVVVNPKRRVSNPNSFFAIDTAQSWLGRADQNNSRFKGDGFEAISDLCRLAGFSMIRDRLSWNGVRKDAQAPYDWAQYTLNADLLNHRGIKLCGMFHDAPKWTRYPTGEAEKSGQTNVPDDLLQTYLFTRELATTFKGKMDCWEFWNEQDHPAHKETPWDFAASSKAAYLGFKAGNPALPVLCGSFCSYPLSHYATLFFRNDGAAYTDIFNYHLYQPLKEYKNAVAGVRQALSRAGVPDMQIYVTENGTNEEGMAKTESYIKKYRQHSREQEMTVAEFVPKSQIMLQSLGVARDFFFVLPAYNEGNGGKDWGLLRRDYSVKAGFAAFANLTWQLADATYLGTYPMPGTVKAFLYQKPDGSQTLALWNSSPLDTGLPNDQSDPLTIEATLAIKPGTYQLSDMFGVMKNIDATTGRAVFPVSRYPSYLIGLRGLLPDQPFAGAGKDGALKSDKDLTVVIKPYFEDGFSISQTRHFVMLEKDSGTVRLEVFNLSNEKKEGKLEVSGVQTAGVPESVTLEPMSKAVFTLTCLRPAESTKQPMSLNVGGTFLGKPISTLYVPLKSAADLANARRVPLAAGSAEAWRSNSSGTMSSSSGQGGGVDFTVAFPKGKDRWVYPEYILKQPQESFAGALGIEFEIKASTPDGKKADTPALVMLVSDPVKEHGASVMMSYAQPTPQWEKRVVLFDESIDGSSVKMLRLGMNPRVDALNYSVRNVNILFPQK